MFAEEAPLISKSIPSPDLTRLRPVLLPLRRVFSLYSFFPNLGVFSHESRKLSREETEASHLACRRRLFFPLPPGF